MSDDFSQNNMENNVTERQIKIGYWYITHKTQLKNVLVVFLVVLNAVFLIYAIMQFRKIYIETDEYNALIERITSQEQALKVREYYQKHKPLDLGIGAVQVISSGRDKYDILIPIKNSNTEWIVSSFDWQIFNNGVEIAKGASFAYALEEKYIAALAVSSAQQIINPSVITSNVKWKRIKDFPVFYKDRVFFSIGQTDYQVLDSVPAQKLPVAQASFNVTNNTAFNYWRVGFLVLLKQGGKVVGANRVFIDQFFSGETKNATVSWFEKLPFSVSKVEVSPELNILDEEIYMPQ